MNQLDHIVIAAADLALALEEFADQTGCRPSPGGSHQGLGTCNALVSFGATSYLEIIAPDPDQPLDGTFGAVLAELEATEPLHWAIRSNDLPAVAERARQLGFEPGPIRDTARVQPDGTRLEWQLLGIRGHDLGGLVPFYIDWLQCPHPADTAPVVGPLNQCTVHASNDSLHELIGTTTGIEIQAGQPCLAFSFESVHGEISYSATAPRGFNL
jgi:hypothetical protein